MAKTQNKRVIKPDVYRECEISIRNIVNDTMVILQRNNPLQKQLLLENALEFNEKLGKLNDETIKILNDESWRDQKK